MFRFSRPGSRRAEGSSKTPARRSIVHNPIGRDFKRMRPPRKPSSLIPAAIAILLSAFALTSLRTEVTKLQYDLTAQLELEQDLRSRQGQLTVEMRQLREPRQLAQRAAQLGFERPQRVIDLPLREAPPIADAAHPAGGAAGASAELNTNVNERLAAVPGSQRP